jgi:TolB-like protein/Tfp pilus assembly protein PilF
MSSVVSGFEYDIFISYRHNDNRSGWVTDFVKHLQEELSATIKEPLSVYFDTNPHDGLLENHDVGKSLAGKLKCLIFIPIISRTYCDTSSFAWKNEFLVFRDLSKTDSLGLDIRLEDGNVASRILPIQIHDISPEDHRVFANENGGPLRSIPFIFKTSGVNRPLMVTDDRSENFYRNLYRDQINKTANAVDGILRSLAANVMATPSSGNPKAIDSVRQSLNGVTGVQWMWRELVRRNVFRAGFAYLIVALASRQMIIIISRVFELSPFISELAFWVLIGAFPFAMSLAWLYEASPQGFIRTSSSASAQNPYKPAQKKPFTGNLMIALLSALVIFQFAYFYFIQNRLSAPSNVGGVASIAVLPFENRSEDQNDVYFADGLTDDIIEHLSIISDLHVINRQSIQGYRGSELSYKNIANELAVANILTGSVRRSGNIVKISARLIECSTNRFLWGETFERDNKDVMLVQSEIAQHIAGELRVRINELEKEKLDHKATLNATAYDYYIRGRVLYYQYTSESNDKAIEQFKMAIGLDPKYALAWAGLGDAYSQLHSRFGKEVSWIDSSVVAGTRAIQLDPNLSDAYKALANAYNYAKQYDTAFSLLKKAVDLNPTNAQAVGNLGTSYFLRGDLVTALQWEKKAAGLNPKNAIPFQIIGLIYRLLGDLPQAEKWLEKSLSLNATSYWDTYELLAYCYASQGRNREALELVDKLMKNVQLDSRAYETAGLMAHFAGDRERARDYFQKSIELNDSYNTDPSTLSPIGLGQILLEAGRRVEAEVYLSHALQINLDEVENGSQDDDPRFCIAGVYAILGDNENARLWLQKSIEANWMDYAQVEHGPWFVRLKDDEKIVALVSQVRKKVDAMRQRAEGG